MKKEQRKKISDFGSESKVLVDLGLDRLKSIGRRKDRARSEFQSI